MKGALVLGLLCLVAVTTAKKASESIEDNVDGELPSVLETSEPHPAKKYGKDHKYYHHHSKHQKPLDSSEHKLHEKFESRKSKHVPKNAPHEVPPLEAELQADLRTSKKHLKDQHVKDAQQDLHLQDLTFEESLKQEKQHLKSPHQFQRGHHKMGHHFTQDKASNMEQSPLDIERKLFVEQNPKKENNKFSHPVLEDSFETLQGEKSNPDYETKKHSKKSKKYKKPVDKAKKSKKMKNAKKDKKEKKNKKDKKSKKY